MFYLSVLCGCEEFSEGTFLSICVIKISSLLSSQLQPVYLPILILIERKQWNSLGLGARLFDCDCSWQTRSVAVFLNDCVESA